MTQTVDKMIAAILKHEGGYVDHGNDRGGATNHGISLKYAKRVGLDNDGDVDRNDIKLVTPAQAAMLYKRDFLIDPGFDKLPVEIQPQVFDMSVLHGPARAGKLLQMAMVFSGAGHPTLKMDGDIGPKSQAAAVEVLARLGAKKFNALLVKYRIEFLKGIVAADPSQKVFLKGWTKRAESFLAPDGPVL